MNTATTTEIMTTGATTHTTASVLVEIDSGTNGYEIERSSSENARSCGETNDRPPPAAAMQLHKSLT